MSSDKLNQIKKLNQDIQKIEESLVEFYKAYTPEGRYSLGSDFYMVVGRNFPMIYEIKEELKKRAGEEVLNDNKG